MKGDYPPIETAIDWFVDESEMIKCEYVSVQTAIDWFANYELKYTSENLNYEIGNAFGTGCAWAPRGPGILLEHVNNSPEGIQLYGRKSACSAEELIPGEIRHYKKPDGAWNSDFVLVHSYDYKDRYNPSINYATLVDKHTGTTYYDICVKWNEFVNFVEKLNIRLAKIHLEQVRFLKECLAKS